MILYTFVEHCQGVYLDFLELSRYSRLEFDCQPFVFFTWIAPFQSRNHLMNSYLSTTVTNQVVCRSSGISVTSARSTRLCSINFVNICRLKEGFSTSRLPGTSLPINPYTDLKGDVSALRERIWNNINSRSSSNCTENQ